MDKLTENIIAAEGEFENEKKYWLAKTEGMPEFSSFPQMSVNPPGSRTDMRVQKHHLPADIANRLFAISDNSPYALYIALVSGVFFVLKKYSGEDRVSIGMPFYKQNIKDDTTQFPNTIFPLVAEIIDQDTFRNMLLKIREAVEGIGHNRNYPLSRIYQESGIHPCFKSASMFNVIAASSSIHESRFYSDEPSDMRFFFHTDENKILIDIHYNAELYPDNFITGLAGYIFHFYHEAALKPGALTGDIPLPLHDRERILSGFNNTDCEFPADKTIHILFEEQAGKTPGNTCLIFRDKKITYAEFNEKANQLAWLLKEKGAGPDSIIALCFDRGFEMMTAVYAVLKAGGAYLPIDPDYPAARKQYLLEDSNALLLLTSDAIAGDFSWEKEIVPVSYERISHQKKTNPPHINKPDHLAYVIYTSGSTGNPKGTMIEHQSLVNRLYWMQKKYQLTENNVILQKTTYTFDVSVWEIFLWALSGASLCILEPKCERYPDIIIDTIQQNKVTTLHFVPSMLGSFLEYIERTDSASSLKSLENVFCSGEALRTDHVEHFNRIIKPIHDANQVNLYGPTEACIDVSYYNCPDDRKIGKVPIGKPIDNIKLYVLDDKKQLAAIGVIGELYISGIGVARGYLNRDQLTAEKFTPDTIINKGRMYSTGDLARFLADGNIECLGRIDHQAKVRGFRIEPGEIESQLLKHASVSQAVVIVREDHKKDNYLCAYIVCNASVDRETINNFLKSSLPEYMVPSFIVFLNRIPLMLNGKVDRKALPDPLQGFEERDSDICFNDITDIKLHEIWRSVLGIENIASGDDFYSLGGNSLKATELIARIHETFRCKLSVKDILDTPVINKLSGKIRESYKGTLPPIPVTPAHQFYPLSAAQKRVYISSQLAGNSIGFNMPGALLIDGIIKIDKLKSAFNTLADRHEILRSSFILHEDEPVQIIHDRCVIDLMYEERIDQTPDSIIRDTDFIRPFDISEAPLLRVKLVKLENTKYLLFCDMHHLISDAVSFKILAKEIHDLYCGNKLPSLRIQYRDYVAWQNSLLDSDFMKRQETYWTKKLSAPIPELKLPADFPSAGENNFNAGIIHLAIDREMTAKLRAITAKNHSTLFMILLSAYFVLLYKYTNASDIVIGIPLSGRQYAELEGLIGMFVNMGAFRNHPSGGKKFSEFAAEIKQEAFEIFENQDYQFDWLVNAMGVERRSSKNPFFNTVFTLQDIAYDNIENDYLKFTPCRMLFNISKFELVLIVQEETDALVVEFQYLISLFKKATVEKISSHYHEILNQIAENSDIYIHEIKISQTFDTAAAFKADEGDFNL